VRREEAFRQGGHRAKEGLSTRADKVLANKVPHQQTRPLSSLDGLSGPRSPVSYLCRPYSPCPILIPKLALGWVSTPAGYPVMGTYNRKRHYGRKSASIVQVGYTITICLRQQADRIKQSLSGLLGHREKFDMQTPAMEAARRIWMTQMDCVRR
jgi:hypothetical protein